MAERRKQMKKATYLLIVILIAAASMADAKQKGRKYYLTKEGFTGSQALTACANNFHMASLWEIFDVSTLRYDTENGITLDDSGSGPPSLSGGWVRTGGISSNTAFLAGRDNCNSWTSDTGSGTFLNLVNIWSNSALTTSPWLAQFFNCSNAFHVWCVQD
jgi:hypothetical protein